MLKTFKKYTGNFKIDTFNNLPLNYKIGLMIYMYEGEPVEWSIIDKIDWVKDLDKIQILINDYSAVYGKRKFKYGLYPTNKLIKKVTDCLGENVWDE